MMDDNPTGRVSIWSVLAKYWNSIVWVLIVFLIIWTSVFVAAYDFAEVANDSADMGSGPFKRGYYVAVALAFVRDYSSYTIGPVMVLTVIIALAMDGKENLKVTLTRWLREKVEEEEKIRARAEGKAQGLSEANRRWSDWYQRMKQAQENNDPFDEPPPDL